MVRSVESVFRKNPDATLSMTEWTRKATPSLDTSTMSASEDAYDGWYVVSTTLDSMALVWGERRIR